MIVAIEIIVFVVELLGIYVLVGLIRDFIKIKNEMQKMVDQINFAKSRLT